VTDIITGKIKFAKKIKNFLFSNLKCDNKLATGPLEKTKKNQKCKIQFLRAGMFFSNSDSQDTEAGQREKTARRRQTASVASCCNLSLPKGINCRASKALAGFFYCKGRTQGSGAVRGGDDFDNLCISYQAVQSRFRVSKPAREPFTRKFRRGKDVTFVHSLPARGLFFSSPRYPAERKERPHRRPLRTEDHEKEGCKGLLLWQPFQ